MDSESDSVEKSKVQSKSYKYCIVPKCTNTTITSPDKIFFQVPKDPKIRKKWCSVAKREPLESSTSTRHCCEDHFDLENDMANYWNYRLMKSAPRLKPGVLPKKFSCQDRTTLPPERTLIGKKRRMALLEEAQETLRFSGFAHLSEPSTSHAPSLSPSPMELDEATAVQTRIPTTATQLDKQIQVNMKPQYRSKSTYVNRQLLTKSVATSPIKYPKEENTVTFPVPTLATKNLMEKFAALTTESSSSVTEEQVEDEEYIPGENSSSSCIELQEEEDNKFAEIMLRGTLMSIERKPKLFLGLPEESYYLIEMLQSKIQAPLVNVLITLKKIKLNDPMTILGIHFGMSPSNASKIFIKTLPIMAYLMEDLIFWPQTKQIRAHIPIPFRARYKNVVSIIDCLEIQIEKPTNALHQSLTWSQYKQCNTLKYLISCTPDGLVNFMSCGYGGRASDVIIVEDCGYLDQIPPGVLIMADRGFKNVSHLIEQRGSKLVRPPSVSSSVASTQQEVRASKQIAALRIHVERDIGRLREFNILLPHACIDHNYVPNVDHIIKIACGLVNMQNHLIKIQI